MRYALSIHDLRVSGDADTVNTLQALLARFPIPLTVLLVFDRPLEKSPTLLAFLQAHTSSGLLEVVFHGTTHQCPHSVGRSLAFYHKYQAEYLQESNKLSMDTQNCFTGAQRLLGSALGICPPCWLATASNWKFLRSLAPLYTESLLWIRYPSKRIFSPVVSLGSPVASELRWLKILGRLLFGMSRLIPGARLRVAIHTCDLAIPDSMTYFTKVLGRLNSRNHSAVLQRHLP